VIGGPLHLFQRYSSPAELGPTILPATSEENLETQLSPPLREYDSGKMLTDRGYTIALPPINSSLCEGSAAEQHARYRHGVSAKCEDLQSKQRRFRVMFAFFSNRLGCVGSLIVSILGSLVLILILRGCGAF
jgi:hypothetical protein